MPYHKLEQRLQAIVASKQVSSLSESLIGLEKECLRVAETGGISQIQHPQSLGSPLTNPFITTDFSEALLELITPPCHSIRSALEFLNDLQVFVYSNLREEILWATSMPCVVESGDSIPIARYGRSNAGKMKTIYRRGLGHRYGRTMQVIAGVHFNYSFSDDFWAMYQYVERDGQHRQAFISEQYMGLIRNILRYGWLIPYLFGASPAVCKSFLHGKPSLLSSFNENTAYEPYATSLRLGDIGYTNNKESMAGIKANYDSLDAYIKNLRCAISTPFDEYEEIGVKVDDEYRQLNANILQIENEYYSTVRPKQVLNDSEMPVNALKQRGIRYIEIRSIDVNAFDPLGINEEQLYFLEIFVLFCLLQNSPILTANEMDEIDMNLVHVAHRGREPDTTLVHNDDVMELKQWAGELLGAMQCIAHALDEVHHCASYSESLKRQQQCALDPEETTSAIMLREMRQHSEGFYHFARRMSMQHYRFFNSLTLSEERRHLFEQAAVDSIAEQKRIEASNSIDFDEFLRRYFAQ
ncbi:MAG: glutamate--cysteine ligase [Gammaproteobacteria bacterium]|nr:glutamate--cysteine ligase [Gammaproteobacteria bacterium]